MANAFIIGCGYTGSRLAAALLAASQGVAALMRRDRGFDALRDGGVEFHQGDLDRPGQLPALPVAGTRLYYLVPPANEGTADMRLGGLLASLPQWGLPERLIYVSTTGVYGNCGGEWVDETRPVNPGSSRARRRVDAEGRVQAFSHRHGVPAVVLRVAGIYGPERLPLQRIAQRAPVVREEEAPYSNRIHVDDLVQALVAAGDLGQSDGVFNVADGQPTTITDYFRRVARQARLPAPPELPRVEALAHLSPTMRNFMQESRRIDNRRLIETLGVSLSYPDLDDGIAASLAAQDPAETAS